MAEVNEERSLRQLKVTYDMYEDTKKETEKKLKSALNKDGTRKYSDDDIKKEMELLNNAQQDVIDQYVYYGGNIEDFKKKTKKKSASEPSKKDVDDIAKAAMDIMNSENEALKRVGEAVGETNARLEQDYIPKKDAVADLATFDIINLPSKGEGYKDKISKVSVSYLTAYDENIIVSPNLYRDNLILDYILNHKLLSKEIDPIDLLEGDRDAIILFLRMSGYGNEYPITATDDATGKEFDTTIDLSKIKMKEFNLKGDSNGWFPFTLPESGIEVKFRFPTHRDTLILEKMKVAEDARMLKDRVSRYVKDLDTFIESDTKTNAEMKANVRKAIRTLESWADDMEDEELKFSKTLTNRFNLLIMSVNGITDKAYISDFIRKMRVKDSSALRKYMTANEPGMDYNITIERPADLGGGSFTTFLQLDQFLFLNLPE